MKKRDDNFALLPEEEKAIIIKKRSHKRVFFAFLILDIFLAIYIIYAFIMIFTHL